MIIIYFSLLHSIMEYFEITLMIVLLAAGQGLGQSHHEHKTHCK